jgi:hypothetical protein
LAEVITGDEIEAEANLLGAKAPLPLKMAGVAIWQAKDINDTFAHSSLSIEAQPIDSRRSSSDRMEGMTFRSTSRSREKSQPGQRSVRRRAGRVS